VASGGVFGGSFFFVGFCRPSMKPWWSVRALIFGRIIFAAKQNPALGRHII
jgi:hypothetical protein